MKFCSECGSAVSMKVPEGDNRDRFVCDSCDTIHYQNPNVVVGTIPLYDDSGTPKILLCKRGIEPRLGYWTLPAGFLENGETTLEGAIRETVEETCAVVTEVSLFSVLNVAQTNQIHMFFKAHLAVPEFSVTPESTEVALFAFEDIPWRQLAFPTVHRALKDFVQAQPLNIFEATMADIVRADWSSLDF